MRGAIKPDFTDVGGNIVECNPARLSIGQPVRVVFKESTSGTAIPCFTPIICDSVIDSTVHEA